MMIVRMRPLSSSFRFPSHRKASQHLISYKKLGKLKDADATAEAL